MQALLDVILPVFLVLGFGYLVTWRGWFPASAVDGLVQFTQSFAVPCLLFRSIATLDLGQSFRTDLLASYYGGTLLAFAAAALAARTLFARGPADSVAIGFAGFFSNTLLLGLPIMERAYGTGALAGNYAIVSVHAPLLYAFGISAIEIARARGTGLSALRVTRQILGTIWRNPLVIGIGLGFAVNLGHIPLPGVAWSAVDMMVRAALPAALFGLGGVLVRYRPEGDMRTIAMICGVALILHPAAVWALGRGIFGLDVAGLRSAVVTAAMAPGVNAYLFANMYGAARRVVASSVLIGTAASILTVWFWLGVLP